MDDFNINTLNESRNEWVSRLITIISPLVFEGYKSILNESIQLCNSNNESKKYLMTFQNLISRIPKWNQSIIESERIRILEKSGCKYLEDLITCVHIIQLKSLTAMRVGQQSKKIELDIPKLDVFLHKLYVNSARKIYTNIYLFEKNIAPLQVQKNNREIECIINESILNTVRENIPIEEILKSYMGETSECDEIIEEIKEEPVALETPSNVSLNTQDNTILPITNNEKVNEIPSNESSIENFSNQDDNIANHIVNDIDNDIKSMELEGNVSHSTQGIQFDNIDYVKDHNNSIHNIEADKSIERLEEISQMRNEQRKQDEIEYDDDDDDYNEKISISNDIVNLDNLEDISDMVIL